jgi:hypothetical protein
VLIARDGLVVAAEVVMGVAEAVPGLRLSLVVAELLERSARRATSPGRRVPAGSGWLSWS